MSKTLSTIYRATVIKQPGNLIYSEGEIKADLGDAEGEHRES